MKFRFLLAVFFLSISAFADDGHEVAGGGDEKELAKARALENIGRGMVAKLEKFLTRVNDPSEVKVTFSFISRINPLKRTIEGKYLAGYDSGRSNFVMDTQTWDDHERCTRADLVWIALTAMQKQYQFQEALYEFGLGSCSFRYSTYEKEIDETRLALLYKADRLQNSGDNIASILHNAFKETKIMVVDQNLHLYDFANQNWYRGRYAKRMKRLTAINYPGKKKLSSVLIVGNRFPTVS